MCETKLSWDISLVWQCKFHLNSWKAWYFWKSVHSCNFFTQGMRAPFRWMHDVSLLIYLIRCIFLSHYLYRAKLVGNLEKRPRPGSLKTPGYSFKILLKQKTRLKFYGFILSGCSYTGNSPGLHLQQTRTCGTWLWTQRAACRCWGRSLVHSPL